MYVYNTHINLKKVFFIVLSMLALFALSQGVWAGEGSEKGWGGVAKTLTGSFDMIGQAITAGSVIAGLGFTIGAIMKFKQHKDNPTQVPVGTPIALVFIGAALLFLPSILEATGYTLFKEGGTTATTKGCVLDSKGKCV